MRLTCEATWCLSGNRNGISPHVRDTPRRLWKPSNLQVCLPHTDTKMSKFSELCKTFLSATHHNHQCQPRRIHPLSLPKVGGLVNPLRGSAARAFLREHLLLRCTPPPHKKKKKRSQGFFMNRQIVTVREKKIVESKAFCTSTPLCNGQNCCSSTRI